MHLGVIADTHGFFDDRVNAVFAGVDLIIHAGDIGKLEVLQELELIAPVLAVEGNNDWFGAFPSERVEHFHGKRILVRHIFGELHQLDDLDRQVLATLSPDVLIFGHSHRPYSEMLGHTMLFNPGSAGPRRFSLPRTVGRLTVSRSRIRGEIISLG